MRRLPVLERVTRYGLTLALFLLAVLWACGAPVQELAVPRRPNVLLILIDDLRPDLGAYGHPIVQSPGIDRLAARGLRFDRAYAQAPVCKPSRTSLLTGLRPDTTGVHDNRTAPRGDLFETVTLPKLFHQNGYYTVSVGKVFHGSGRKIGWSDSEAWDLERFPRETIREPQIGGRGPERGWVGRYRWRASLAGDDGFMDVRVAQRAIAVLEADRSEPLFMAIGLSGPHPHYVAPARFFDLYPLESIPQPPSSLPRSGPESYALRVWSDQKNGRFTARQQRELVRAYWACVTSVDNQVAQILDALDRLGLTDSTVVALVSDHGYHLGEHDWWSKHTLFETGTRVPLIISAPGMPTNGRSSDRLVELVDLYPTLADLAGLEPPAALEGRSLVPLLADPTVAWKQAAFSQMVLGEVTGRSVRTDRWRYTEWNNGDKGVELYDHQRDTRELDNLAEDPNLEGVRRQLGDSLRSGFDQGTD